MSKVKPFMIVIGIAAILLLLFIMYDAGQFNITGTTTCNDPILDSNGAQVQTWGQLQTLTGGSQADLESIGVQMTDKGLINTQCPVPLEATP